MVPPVVAQTTVADPLAVAASFGLFALALSATAHVAARNVLGDVPVRKALLVGPVPAAISYAAGVFDLSPLLLLLVAIAVDGVIITRVYEQRARTGAYITLIHFVVTVIVGAVLFGLLALLSSAPG